MWKKRNGKCVYFFFLNTYSLQDLNRNSFLSLALASFSLLWLYTRRIISSTFHMEDERGQQLKDNPKWSISSNSLIMSSFTLEWTRTFKAHQLFVKFISFFRLLSFVTYTYVMLMWDTQRNCAGSLWWCRLHPQTSSTQNSIKLKVKRSNIIFLGVVSLLKLKSKGLHNWLLVLYYKCPMRYSGEPQYGNDDFLNHVVDRWNVVDQREKRIVPVAYRLSMNRGRVCSWLLIFQLFSLFCVFFLKFIIRFSLGIEVKPSLSVE